MKNRMAYCVLMIAFSCQLLTLSKTANAAEDLVISQCFAPQGNGGNYAATLGWMSETIRLRIEEGLSIEQRTGQIVKLHLGCMTGGSSASQVTGIMMNLLQNQQLIPGADADRLFSLVEAQIISDALRFLSLTADAAALEMLNLYRQVVLESLEGKVLSSLGKIRILERFARRVSGNRTPSWWDAQTVNGDQILVDFMTTSLLASTMNRNLLYGESLSDLDTSTLTGNDIFARERDVHLCRYDSLADIPRKGTLRYEFDRAVEDLDSRAAELGERADKFISSQFRLGAFKSRYWFGPYNARGPLRDVAEMPMGKGFCTITMGVVYPSAADIRLNQVPDYSDIRTVVICSADTIDEFLSQPEFLSDLDQNPLLENFVLVEVKNLRGALALALREPLMMSELAGEVGSRRIELLSYFDPAFHTTPARVPFDGEGFAVLGGWPDRRISAWLISYYLLGNIERFENEGYEAKGYMSMFGKPDEREVDKFDTRAIRNLFSGSPEEAELNVADWFAFQDAYCSSFLSRFDALNIHRETVVFNWDISKIPAAQSRRSRLLTALSINATQLQIPHENLAFVFDALVDSDYIQDDDIIPCTYSELAIE